jgi:hypothetical protein
MSVQIAPPNSDGPDGLRLSAYPFASVQLAPPDSDGADGKTVTAGSMTFAWPMVAPDATDGTDGVAVSRLVYILPDVIIGGGPAGAAYG